jgi:hypothetical protein
MPAMKFSASSDLSPWNLIQELTALEATSLIVGIDPARTDIPESEAARARVMERAMREAISRAAHLAWEWFDDREPEEMPPGPDVWEQEEDFSTYLPTSELRESAGAVLADPVNAAILLEIDPWYSATVFADDLRNWLAGNDIEPAYKFHDAQVVTVVPKDYKAIVDSQRELNGLPPLDSELRDASVAAMQKDKTLAPKERTALLNLVGALFELIQSPRPGRTSDAAVIRELVENYPDRHGISKSNLDRKIPEAKRSLRAG